MSNNIKLFINHHKQDIFAVAILIILLAVFFFDPLFTGKAYYIDDVEAHHYFLRSFQRDMGLAGKLFFWNPYLFSGEPFLADNQNALFYPVNWLYFFVDPARGIVYFTVIHFFLAGLFSYIYLRGRKLSSAAALSGAVFYAFSGFMVMRVLHLHFMAATVLIPLILYFSDRFIEERTLSNALFLGLMMGIHLLSGTYQYSQLMFFVVFIYIAVNFNFKKILSPENLRLAGFFALSVLFSLAFSSIQLFPTYEFLTHTHRLGGVPFEDASGGSAGFREMMLTVVPDYMGNPISPQGYTGDFYYWEICFYMGIFPIILALAAPFIAQEKHRKVMTAMGLIAVLGILLGVGKYLPVFGLFHRFVPFFNSARIPSRYLAALLPVVMFFIGVSVDSLQKILMGERTLENERKQKLSTAIIALFAIPAVFLLIFPPMTGRGTTFFIITGISGIALILTVLWSNIRIRPGIFSSAIITLLIISAFSFGFTWNLTVDCSYYSSRTQFLIPVQDKIPPVRIHYFPPFELLSSLNLTGTRRVSNISGYNSFALQDYITYIVYADYELELTPKISRQFINNANRFSVNNFQSQMIKLLNLKYYYEFQGSFPVYSIVRQEVKDPYPRAFICYDYRLMEKGPEMLKMMRSGEIDPEKTILLEEHPGFEAGADAEGNEAGKDVTIPEFSPDYIKMNIKTDKPGVLFLSEIYYPGWKARVDGKERKLLRADWMFRGIPVKAGEQVVEVYFSSDSFRAGAMVSLGSILAFLAVLIWRRAVGRGRIAEGGCRIRRSDFQSRPPVDGG